MDAVGVLLLVAFVPLVDADAARPDSERIQAIADQLAMAVGPDWPARTAGMGFPFIYVDGNEGAATWFGGPRDMPTPRETFELRAGPVRGQVLGRIAWATFRIGNATRSLPAVILLTRPEDEWQVRIAALGDSDPPDANFWPEVEAILDDFAALPVDERPAPFHGLHLPLAVLDGDLGQMAMFDDPEALGQRQGDSGLRPRDNQVYRAGCASLAVCTVGDLCHVFMLLQTERAIHVVAVGAAGADMVSPLGLPGNTETPDPILSGDRQLDAEAMNALAALCAVVAEEPLTPSQYALLRQSLTEDLTVMTDQELASLRETCQLYRAWLATPSERRSSGLESLRQQFLDILHTAGAARTANFVLNVAELAGAAERNVVERPFRLRMQAARALAELRIFLRCVAGGEDFAPSEELLDDEAANLQRAAAGCQDAALDPFEDFDVTWERFRHLWRHADEAMRSEIGNALLRAMEGNPEAFPPPPAITDTLSGLQ